MHLVKIVCFLDGWLVNEVIYFIYFNLFHGKKEISTIYLSIRNDLTFSIALKLKCTNFHPRANVVPLKSYRKIVKTTGQRNAY